MLAVAEVVLIHLVQVKELAAQALVAMVVQEAHQRQQAELLIQVQVAVVLLTVQALLQADTLLVQAVLVS